MGLQHEASTTTALAHMENCWPSIYNMQGLTFTTCKGRRVQHARDDAYNMRGAQALIGQPWLKHRAAQAQGNSDTEQFRHRATQAQSNSERYPKVCRFSQGITLPLGYEPTSWPKYQKRTHTTSGPRCNGLHAQEIALCTRCRCDRMKAQATLHWAAWDRSLTCKAPFFTMC